MFLDFEEESYLSQFLLFFWDIKELIYLGLYTAICASIFVIFTDYKSISFSYLKKIFPACTYLEQILWVFLFYVFIHEFVLVKIFAIFLLIFSWRIYNVWILWIWKNNLIKKIILFLLMNNPRIYFEQEKTSLLLWLSKMILKR